MPDVLLLVDQLSLSVAMLETGVPELLKITIFDLLF